MAHPSAPVRSVPLQPLDVAPSSRLALRDYSYAPYADALPHILRAMAAQNAPELISNPPYPARPIAIAPHFTQHVPQQVPPAPTYSDALPLQQVPPIAVGPTMVDTTTGGLESCFFYRSPNPTVRQRTAQACDKCRDRKTKCTGTRPTCKRCEQRGLTCHYASEARNNRGGRKTVPAAESDESAPMEVDSDPSSSNASPGPSTQPLPAVDETEPVSAQSTDDLSYPIAPLPTRPQYHIPDLTINTPSVFVPNGHVAGLSAYDQLALALCDESPPSSATSATFTDASSSGFSDSLFGLNGSGDDLQSFMGYMPQSFLGTEEAISSPSPGSSVGGQLNDDLVELLLARSQTGIPELSPPTLDVANDLSKMSDEELGAFHDTLYAQIFGTDNMFLQDTPKQLDHTHGDDELFQFMNTDLMFDSSNGNTAA